MGTHWEGLNILLYAKILRAQTMAKVCTRWNYFDMKRNPSSNTLLRLKKLYIYSSIFMSTEGSDPYKGAFRVN